MCCSPYRNALDFLRVRLGSLCRFYHKCEHYSATSHTCNRALDKTYCEKYREFIGIIIKVGDDSKDEDV
jgi:hypothetical protein